MRPPIDLVLMRSADHPPQKASILELVARDLGARAILSSETFAAESPTLEGGCRLRPRQGDCRGSRGRTELVEFRVTIDAPICARNANVSAPIPHKLTAFFVAESLLRDNAPAESDQVAHETPAWCEDSHNRPGSAEKRTPDC